MFDSFSFQSHTADRHIHEHRAPTDESIKLYKELKEKAEASIVEAVTLQSSIFEAIIHRHDSAIDLRTHFIVMYSLNGNKRKIQIEIDDYKSSIEAHIEKILKSISEDIAKLLLSQTWRSIK